MKTIKRVLALVLVMALLCACTIPVSADDPEFEEDWYKWETLTGNYTKNDDGTWNVDAWNWFAQRLYKKPVGSDVTIEMAVSEVGDGSYWGLICRADSLENQNDTVEKMNACVARVIRAGSEFDSSCYIYYRWADGTSRAHSEPVDSDLSKKHVMRLVAEGDTITVYYDDMYTPVMKFEDCGWRGEYVGIYHAINRGTNPQGTTKIHYVKINDEVVLGEYDGSVEELNPNPPTTTKPTTTTKAPTTTTVATTTATPTTASTTTSTTVAEADDSSVEESAADTSVEDIFVDVSANSEPVSGGSEGDTGDADDPNVGWIIGIVAVVIVVAAAAVTAVLVIKKKKKAE